MILLDTSFIVSYFNFRDENHKKALKIFDEISRLKYGEAVISDYIFDELATILFIRLKNFLKVVNVCSDMKNLIKFKISEEFFDETWNFFSSQEGTKFSFTDCSSIALMEKEEINYLATFDKEFLKIKEIEVVS